MDNILENTKTINGSQIDSSYAVHGVVVVGTTAHFTKTSNGNANAAFQFTGLSPILTNANIELKWQDLGIPEINTNLGLYNYSTKKIDWYLADVVTRLEQDDLKNYINEDGKLVILVWLNLAKDKTGKLEKTAILETLTLNY